MGRPRKQTVDYFPHFVSTDSRTKFILEQSWGNDGYAFWFKLLELLGRSEGHYYDCSQPADKMYLVALTKVTEEQADAILDTAGGKHQLSLHLPARSERGGAGPVPRGAAEATAAGHRGDGRRMGARAGREEQGKSGDRGGIASPASSRGAGASEGERVGKIPPGQTAALTGRSDHFRGATKMMYGKKQRRRCFLYFPIIGERR